MKNCHKIQTEYFWPLKTVVPQIPDSQDRTLTPAAAKSLLLAGHSTDNDNHFIAGIPKLWVDIFFYQINIYCYIQIKLPFIVRDFNLKEFFKKVTLKVLSNNCLNYMSAASSF
jgi:hypothetical protein